ncbi:succinic semialdehyde dehydrogenase [Catellatospora bangladeshensis]|uniref:Succinic semialdehyde dehydrogenase n=1 Tax=Catellatospora bangladeshensis TaxID=310355 RepID=A0A8J3JS09_9ACTN|nr:succinic semialdehyde dehydrogenase [Catellatospora bangladeshensis]GIF85583.1 succinic semialdehyde dehydrogenase [Catellatospora bangladeshensis]
MGSPQRRGEDVVTRTPFTGEPLAIVRQSTTADVATAYADARAAQPAWAARPPRERARVVRRFARALLDRQAEILDLVQLETGKARTYAHEEVLDAALVSLYYARRAPRLLRPRHRRGALPLLTRVTEVRHPIGTVAVITPWNYPLALAVSDIVPALLAGNAVVHKPDTQTARTAAWARDLLVACGLPEAVWQQVLGEPAAIGEALLDGADHISLTGSSAAGRTVAARAGQRLVGCSLELGGKNALLVRADADLDRAAQAAVRACFASAGQLCLSIERIIVDDTVHDAFLARFLPLVRALHTGPGLSFGPELGSLTLPRTMDATRRHVTDALARGATLLTGGRPRPELGPLFHEPTVLTGVTPDMDVYREETFGPVVSVYAVSGDDAAVALANDTRYGLNAAVFSRDVRAAERLARRLHAGTVNINEGYAAAYASHDAPMGGMKASGLGRRHGTGGLLAYTEAQTIATQRLLRLDPPPWLGQARHAWLLTAAVRAMHALRLH